MKLIIKQYLAALKERNELDAILPDLLSEIGLSVYSRPGRGTRQDGVDVAAVGSLDGGSEKVYLFSIKAGNLTRNSWDGDPIQSLRPSLNEILDTYIPNRLPNKHRNKDIVVCLCFGGDIQEQVRPQVEGYIKQHKKNNLEFEEWNGDVIASRIQSCFLREELMPMNFRSQLRKSLALLDEPDASYQHFSTLIRSISNLQSRKIKDRITAIRQINICLWILFAWAREGGNTESAYMSGELSLLHGWEITKNHADKKTKNAKAIQLAFNSILHVYQQICLQYLNENILPHAHKQHALSSAVHPSCHLDVNLKLFNVLSRLSMSGIWLNWSLTRIDEKEIATKNKIWQQIQIYSTALKQMISNNPTLFLPIKDDQAIDISIAVSLMAVDSSNRADIIFWLSEIANRASFALQTQGQYPCNLRTYVELLDHPQKNDDDYFKENTCGSTLYPMIALWASLLGDDEFYSRIQSIKEQYLGHCNFQFWYPDESSEEHLYTDSDTHGATLSHVCIDRPSKDFQEQAFAECEHGSHFKTLSAVKYGLWPLVLVACRHYRLPVPLDLWKGLLNS